MQQLKPIAGLAIIRNTYYRPEALAATVVWARDRLLGNLSSWERRYLEAEIARIERVA